MSKKRIPFATGGWVNTQSSGDMPFSGEMVVSKDEQERLRAILQQPIPETHHVTINLDDLTMAEKRKLLRR